MPRPRQTAIEQLIRLCAAMSAEELYMAQGVLMAMTQRTKCGPVNAALELREEEING